MHTDNHTFKKKNFLNLTFDKVTLILHTAHSENMIDTVGNWI